MLESGVYQAVCEEYPSDYFEAIPLIPFGQWLLPIGFFLLIVGFCAERNRKVEIFSLYRYGTVSDWWIRHVCER